MAVSLVIDYLRGARKGQREIVNNVERVSFGRHPDNHVLFDAQVDIDASSRHAELLCENDAYFLRDIGSSNGTFIGGEKIDECALRLEVAVEVEFGSGGPVLRLWLGNDQTRAPSIKPVHRGWRRFVPW